LRNSNKFVKWDIGPSLLDITARGVFTEIKKNNIANLTHLEEQLWLLFVQNLLEQEFLTIQKSN
jgi:hypothetical protein